MLTSEPTSGRGKPRPTPGSSHCTMTNPRKSDTMEAHKNQPTVKKPIRLKDAVSPTWTMPTTNVENTNGPMIILINRRKISVRIEK